MSAGGARQTRHRSGSDGETECDPLAPGRRPVVSVVQRVGTVPVR